MAEQPPLEHVLERIIALARMDPPAFDQPPTTEGLAKQLAAAGVVRSARLLEEMLGCAAINADEALRLNLRLITETDVHSRYLLAKGASALEQLGANEARRRYNLARRLYGPSDERVIELRAEVAELPRELSIGAMAKQGGTDLTYRVLYAALSHFHAHAGLGAMRRYLSRAGMQIRINYHPALELERTEALATAGLLVGGLLRTVREAYGLPLLAELDELAVALDHYANR
jgi:hypothetical protein